MGIVPTNQIKNQFSILGWIAIALILLHFGIYLFIETKIMIINLKDVLAKLKKNIQKNIENF